MLCFLLAACREILQGFVDSDGDHRLSRCLRNSRRIELWRVFHCYVRHRRILSRRLELGARAKECICI
jgi:hypothetical protein